MGSKATVVRGQRVGEQPPSLISDADTTLKPDSAPDDPGKSERNEHHHCPGTAEVSERPDRDRNHNAEQDAGDEREQNSNQHQQQSITTDPHGLPPSDPQNGKQAHPRTRQIMTIESPISISTYGAAQGKST